MFSLKTNQESVEFANVAEVFNKDGKAESLEIDSLVVILPILLLS